MCDVLHAYPWKASRILPPRLSILELCEISDPPTPLSPIPSSPTHVLLTRQERERKPLPVPPCFRERRAKAKAIFKRKTKRSEVKNRITISRGRAQTSLASRRVEEEEEEEETSEVGRKTVGRRRVAVESLLLSSPRLESS